MIPVRFGRLGREARSVAPCARLGSSSPCKGEDRWGSAASPFSQTPEVKLTSRPVMRTAFRLRLRPATPTLILPLLGGGKCGEVDR
jgi:hypothetical protein